MDLCSIPVSNPIVRTHISSWNSRSTIGSCGNLKFLEIKVSETKPLGNQSFVIRAIGKKKNNSNNDSENQNSSSSRKGNGSESNGKGDDQKGSNHSESNKSEGIGSQMSYPKSLDWRRFRAALYVQEQAEIAVSEGHDQDQVSSGSKSLPQKWAHPISAPENGCLLVATEKLDGVEPFERTVILLLRAGTRQHPQEGPFGIIINRPHHKRIKHLKPTNLDLQTVFAECPVHLGGPLEASMFLLKSVENPKLVGIEEVIPGLFFGARNSLDGASALVKKGVLKIQDFRFFIGYAGWQLDQLKDEIDSGFWYVAASSADLIFGTSQKSSSPEEDLWKEILQLMGGHYSELSHKPKQDT